MKDQEINSILLICMGNICRSPTAEAIFRYHARQRGLSLQIDSAGTIGYHAGEAPDSRARAAGEGRGYSFAGMQARQISREDLERFDLILMADRQNMADVKRLASSAQVSKLGYILGEGEVPDPYYGGDKGFEQVLDLVEQGAHYWLDKIEQS